LLLVDFSVLLGVARRASLRRGILFSCIGSRFPFVAEAAGGADAEDALLIVAYIAKEVEVVIDEVAGASFEVGRDCMIHFYKSAVALRHSTIADIIERQAYAYERIQVIDVYAIIEMVEASDSCANNACVIGAVAGKRAVVARIVLLKVVYKGIVAGCGRHANMVEESVFQLAVHGRKTGCTTLLETYRQRVILAVAIHKANGKSGGGCVLFIYRFPMLLSYHRLGLLLANADDGSENEQYGEDVFHLL